MTQEIPQLNTFQDAFEYFVRQKRGNFPALTQQQLVELTGISKSKIDNWFKGRTKSKPQNWRDIIKLAKVTQLSKSETDLFLKASKHLTIDVLSGKYGDHEEDFQLLSHWENTEGGNTPDSQRQSNSPSFYIDNRIPIAATSSKFGIELFLEEYLGNQDKGVQAPPFGGRDDLLSQLDSWLISHNSPQFGLMAAEAGRGKSAILAHWAAKLVNDGEVDVVFYPLTMRYGTTKEIDLYETLAELLANVIGVELPKANIVEWPTEFKKLLQYKEVLSRKILIIIDGLDEGVWINEPSENFLPTHINTEIKILLSARYQVGDTNSNGWANRLGLVRGRNAERFEVPDLGREGLADVLKKMGNPLNQLTANFDVLSQLVELTEGGDPLLVKLYVESLTLQLSSEEAGFTITDLPDIPAGLEGYFKTWWEAQEKSWKKEGLDPISRNALDLFWDLCAGAYEPLMEQDISVLANGKLGRSKARKRIINLTNRFVIGDGKTQGFVFSHPKLAYYFWEKLDEQDQEEVEARFLKYGHETLNELSSSPPTSSDDDRLIKYAYPLQNFAIHQNRAWKNRTNDVNLADQYALVEEGWIRAKEFLTGDHNAFLNDLLLIWQRASHENNLKVQLHCSLIQSSIRSQNAVMNSEFFKKLMTENVISDSQAISLIQKSTKDNKKSLVEIFLKNCDPKYREQAITLVSELSDSRDRLKLLEWMWKADWVREYFLSLRALVNNLEIKHKPVGLLLLSIFEPLAIGFQSRLQGIRIIKQMNSEQDQIRSIEYFFRYKRLSKANRMRLINILESMKLLHLTIQGIHCYEYHFTENEVSTLKEQILKRIDVIPDSYEKAQRIITTIDWIDQKKLINVGEELIQLIEQVEAKNRVTLLVDYHKIFPKVNLEEIIFSTLQDFPLETSFARKDSLRHDSKVRAFENFLDISLGKHHQTLWEMVCKEPLQIKFEVFKKFIDTEGQSLFSIDEVFNICTEFDAKMRLEVYSILLKNNLQIRNQVFYSIYTAWGELDSDLDRLERLKKDINLLPIDLLIKIEKDILGFENQTNKIVGLVYISLRQNRKTIIKRLIDSLDDVETKVSALCFSIEKNPDLFGQTEINQALTLIEGFDRSKQGNAYYRIYNLLPDQNPDFLAMLFQHSRIINDNVYQLVFQKQLEGFSNNNQHIFQKEVLDFSGFKLGRDELNYFLTNYVKDAPDDIKEFYLPHLNKWKPNSHNFFRAFSKIYPNLNTQLRLKLIDNYWGKTFEFEDDFPDNNKLVNLILEYQTEEIVDELLQRIFELEHVDLKYQLLRLCLKKVSIQQKNKIANYLELNSESEGEDILWNLIHLFFEIDSVETKQDYAEKILELVKSGYPLPRYPGEWTKIFGLAKHEQIDELVRYLIKNQKENCLTVLISSLAFVFPTIKNEILDYFIDRFSSPDEDRNTLYFLPDLIPYLNDDQLKESLLVFANFYANNDHYPFITERILKSLPRALHKYFFSLFKQFKGKSLSLLLGYAIPYHTDEEDLQTFLELGESITDLDEVNFLARDFIEHFPVKFAPRILALINKAKNTQRSIDTRIKYLNAYSRDIEVESKNLIIEGILKDIEELITSNDEEKRYAARFDEVLMWYFDSHHFDQFLTIVDSAEPEIRIDIYTRVIQYLPQKIQESVLDSLANYPNSDWEKKKIISHFIRTSPVKHLKNLRNQINDQFDLRDQVELFLSLHGNLSNKNRLLIEGEIHNLYWQLTEDEDRLNIIKYLVSHTEISEAEILHLVSELDGTQSITSMIQMIQNRWLHWIDREPKKAAESLGMLLQKWSTQIRSEYLIILEVLFPVLQASIGDQQSQNSFVTLGSDFDQVIELWP